LKLRLLYYYPAVGALHGYAGSQRTLEFAKSLARNGVKVYLASPYLKSYNTNENVDLLPLPKDPFGILYQLKNYVVQNKINVILERLEGGNIMSSGYGVVAGKIMKIPVACEIHVPPYDLRTRLTSFAWLRYSLKNSDKIFVISHNVSELLYLHYKYCKNKIVVIPNGYDASKLTHLDNLVKKVKQNLPRDRKIICYFGELNEDKGVDLILQLINNDKKKHFYFIIGGWGPLEQVIRKIAEEKPEKVRYVGKISKEEVYAYLKVCDLSLAFYRRTQLGTLFFGQPLKVYESLALGTNVLITTRANLPEDVFNLCTFVEPKLEDIFEKIEGACLKKYDSAWQEQVKKTMDKYSWDNIAKKIFIPQLRSLMMQRCAQKK
jgi:glycosyltransferase involved in cell wall biosynthesis